MRGSTESNTGSIRLTDRLPSADEIAHRLTQITQEQSVLRQMLKAAARRERYEAGAREGGNRGR